jgi:ribonuclease-3
MKLEEKIGITFNNPHLLRQALIHKSYLNEKDAKESNERLEFLGDAILEFIVSEYLFKRFEKADEGLLTVLRARLVNAKALADVANKLGVGDALLLSFGEEKGGGRTNPTLLSNATEAIIGAIFLDQGIEKAKEFVYKFILAKLPETVKKSLKDPKSKFQEFVQANGYPAPRYRVVSESGPDHAKKFIVEVLVSGKSYAQAEGQSKKEAEQKAAEAALARWTQKN